MGYDHKNRILALDNKIITDVFIAPEAVDNDQIKTATAIQAGASWVDVTWESGDLTAQPNYARNVTLTFVDADTSITAGTVTITGTDLRGNTVSEIITGIATASSLTYSGDIAFATITSIVLSDFVGATQTNDTLKIGNGKIFGLSNELDDSNDVTKVIENETDSTTYTVSTTYNTIEFAADPDGSKNYAVYYKSKTVW